ncbi:MAG: hypothetical protein HQK87_00035 [Nitrospinae bacterium]|nr:hypothetical protein [Nitrospinota bacterium]
MSAYSLLPGFPPVIGVTCGEGHFRKSRRRLASPLFPVGLATLGCIVDFFWLLPDAVVSLYLPVGLFNVVAAWGVTVFTARLRDRLFPLPRRCPTCQGRLEQFRATTDEVGGPTVVEIVSAGIFVIPHLAMLFLI